MWKIGKKKKKNDVRIDNINSNLLRQFNLSGRQKEKAVQVKHVYRKPSSLLYLCLVLGVCIGIGSAFADKEILPNDKPLDQPIEQQVDMKKEVEEGQREELREEQKEEPTSVEESKVEQTETEKNTTTDGNEDENKVNGDTKEEMQHQSRYDEYNHQDQSGNKEKMMKGYQTEVGGELPHTAGNDFFYLTVGVVLLLIGVVLGRKKRIVT